MVHEKEAFHKGLQDTLPTNNMSQSKFDFSSSFKKGLVE